MMDPNLAMEVLSRAQSGGADYAELFMEDTESTHIELLNDSVEKANYVRISGAGIRVLLGTRSAYAYTADLSPTALRDTAAAAAAALKGTKAEQGIVFSMQRYVTAQQIPFAFVSNDRRVALLKSAAKAARSTSAEVSQALAGYLDQVQRVMIASSDGILVYDERPRTRGYVRAVAMANAQAQTGFDGPGCCRGFEAYSGTIDLDAAGCTAANMAVTMLHAPECPAGVLPVVIDGGFGGVIFHEACGHALEATSVSKGNSVFCGKLGQKIASNCVNAVDDGTLPNEWGSINIDDEGTPAQRNPLIENGVLKGYLIDKLGARRMGMQITGSSRRQSYAYAPTSRMTNTFICAGNDSEDEMIQTVGEGLYAKKMGGGSVNPATGEFNFAVNEGYWIKNGQIVTPVRGATLVGKGADVLQKIDRVGPRMWMAQGMCGSISGSVPTNVGQPRIRVSGMTIGGKGGAKL
ncbi:MAG: TldD/PmbA family protein [Clostridia bacterium]